MADSEKPLIVVKKISKKHAGGHGSSAWKIAYADFVTAMMAFFLLLWLLGSTSKGDLNGIADYFKTPLKVALQGGSGSGDSSSVLQGGGRDLTARSGQVKNGEVSAPKKTYTIKTTTEQTEKAEIEKLRGLKQQLEQMIDRNPLLTKFKKQLLIDITTDGLRIQIVDEQNRPMFELAKAELQPYTKEILHEIGRTLNNVPNRISLSGHTDMKPYANGEKGYSNWELSADRANASRRELIAGGMGEDRVLRVVGLSSAIPLDKENGFNPINRRISIIVMTKKAEEALISEGKNRTVSASSEVQPKADALANH